MKKIFFTGLTLYLCLFLLQTETWAQGFTDQAANAGIALTHDGDTSLDLLSIGTGAAWFDYDNDGDLDLYVTMRYTGNKLYENDGAGNFTDVAVALGVADAAGDGSGVAVADINNDGFQDIYLANSDEDRLFLNNGGTSFTDITASAGFNMTDDSRGTSASWGDYDKDGFIDLYVSHHQVMPSSANSSRQDKLYHNNGNNTFKDVSYLFNLDDLLGAGFIGGWTDFDDDGDADIVLINDCLPPTITTQTKVFRNDGGTNAIEDWDFVECAVAIGIDDCRNGMGIAVGDYNRDNKMDIFYSDYGPAVLYKNGNGTVPFEDVSVEAGVDGQALSDFSWGTFFFDYDLDGWQDLFVVLGSHHYPSSTDPQNDMLFHNNGNGIDFTDVSVSMNMADASRGRTCVYGDYDNDGDLDVFLANFGEAVQLKRNDNNNGHHYLKVHLEGTISNRDGIGARLKLTTGDAAIQYFETRSGSSLGGGDQIDAHFGLGTNTTISTLEVTWPSGIIDVVNNPPIDQTLNVLEGSSLLDADMDGYNSSDDCNDNNASVNPAAAEIANNNVDENCDGILLIIDADMDGYNSSDDCNDNNASVNPAAAEIANNNVDENCDGILLIIDVDMDGYNSSDDCNDNNASVNPAAAEIANNNVDENCDGILLIIDVDMDGYNSSDDCNDNNATINPAAAETTYNGMDDDCNPATLDDDLDQDGYVIAEDCNDADVFINPAALEIPNNGIDEDCNGEDQMVGAEEVFDLALKIYPNPTDGQVQVQIGAEEATLRVYDVRGLMVLEEYFVGNTELDLSAFPVGLYAVCIQSEHGLWIEKLLKELK